MSDLCVRDCMHEGVISCSPEAGLEEVASVMRERGISAVVVMQDGLLAGLISKTDLVNASFIEPYMRYWRGMVARHLMTAPVVSIRPEAPLVEALTLLRARRIHRLVVAEPAAGGERPVGILSVTDIAEALGDRPVPSEP
ncbi:MAG: CBS domain-containing protein [Candidatus Rokubacteria bacterium]|nr:CBS domain-containing protein [Candidatus Rokubacteria bacterium]